MSRFWGAGSDSESDEDDVELSQEEDSNVESDGEEGSGEETGFFDRPDSDDEEPDVKRVVRSQRDKRNEAMNNSIRSIKNAVKINDWVAIQDGWIFFLSSYCCLPFPVALTCHVCVILVL